MNIPETIRQDIVEGAKERVKLLRADLIVFETAEDIHAPYRSSVIRDTKKRIHDLDAFIEEHDE